MLTCIDSFDVEILDFERIFHEGDRVFRVLKGYVDWGGGRLAPFADAGASAWSSAGWLVGRPLCVCPFSGVVGGDRLLCLSVCMGCACDVAFFIGAAGEVIVRTSLLLFLFSGNVARDVGCLFAFFLNISFVFFILSTIVF